MTREIKAALVAALMAVAGCAGGPGPAPETGRGTPEAELAPEARDLLAEGDAAAAEADRIGTELRMLEGRRAALAEGREATRARDDAAADGGGDDAAGEQLDALEALIADRATAREAAQARARALWDRAASIDPDAQDAILKRLRGTRPTS